MAARLHLLPTYSHGVPASKILTRRHTEQKTAAQVQQSNFAGVPAQHQRPFIRCNKFAASSSRSHSLSLSLSLSHSLLDLSFAFLPSKPRLRPLWLRFAPHSPKGDNHTLAQRCRLHCYHFYGTCPTRGREGDGLPPSFLVAMHTFPSSLLSDRFHRNRNSISVTLPAGCSIA